LGERKTEDLKVTGSIPVGGTFSFHFQDNLSLLQKLSKNGNIYGICAKKNYSMECYILCANSAQNNNIINIHKITLQVE